jgi:hypothetical protein
MPEPIGFVILPFQAGEVLFQGKIESLAASLTGLFVETIEYCI